MTEREHLERVERATGRRPEQLDGPGCPDVLSYVFGWFMELSAARGSGGFGVSPIDHKEILAWGWLTCTRPTPFEVDCLRRLDVVFIKAGTAGRNKPGDKPPPAGGSK